MYIIHQSITGNDPRLHESFVEVGHYWHFTITQVPDDQGIYIDWLSYLELPEEVAKCSILTNNYKGVVSLTKPTNRVEDMVTASGDIEWEKYVYRLTDQDKQNVTALMKSAMKLYATDTLDDRKLLKKLLNKVESCQNQEDCEQIMHHYYKVSLSPTTNKQPREPEFNIKWPGNEK